MAMGENDCVSMRAPGFSSPGMRSAMIRRHCVCNAASRVTAACGGRRSRQSATPPPDSPIASRIGSPVQAPRRLIRISARSRQGKTELPTPLTVALGPAGFCRRESRDASQRSLHAG